MVLAVALARRVVGIVGQYTCMIGYAASSINSRLVRGAGGVGGFGASEADRFRALWGDAAADPRQHRQRARRHAQKWTTPSEPVELLGSLLDR